MLAKMSSAIDAEWLPIEPVMVGPVPAFVGTPQCFVTVANGGNPIMRVDIYPYQPDCYAFQDAIVWRGNLIIGFGSYVHAISMADRSTVTIALASYFGHLYPTLEYLLIASAERLFRMEPDRSIRWASEALGIDGVVVHDSGPPVVRGEGEWDPPGGWHPFEVLAIDGKPSS